MLPDLPRDTGGPVFAEPWQAEAFALAVRLSAQGYFSWKEWAAALADELASAERRLAHAMHHRSDAEQGLAHAMQHRSDAEQGLAHPTQHRSDAARGSADALPQPPQTDDGSLYYQCWLTALERLVVAKGLADPASLLAQKEAWAEAYRSTPHGLPVDLRDSIRR